jgi:hypothetical protein
MNVIPALLLGASALILVTSRRTVRSVVPKPVLALAWIALVAAPLLPLAGPSLGRAWWRLARVLGIGSFPWFEGLALAGLFAFIAALGYVYKDAKRRGMPAVPWALAALLIPNLLGFVLYFMLRRPLLETCGHCETRIESGQGFCPHCGKPRAAAPSQPQVSESA